MKTRYKLNAFVITKNGHTLSRATNSYKKSHPIQKFFAEKVGQPEKIYLHAEIRAMIAASISDYGIMHTLTVTRYDKNSKYMDAKPCPICVEAAIFFGIKKINYSIKNGMVYGTTPEALKAEYLNSKGK